VDDDEEPAERRRSQNPFRDSPGSGFVVADGPTTGIVYSPDGYIVTGSFNFVREPILITVTLADGRRLAADLVARDQVRKIALLKVSATNLPVPRWCDVVDVRVGQWAVALGLGFGGDEPSVTVGVVSALSRMHDNAVQTDAKLSPANYGGPLCDIHGRIIGICVPMAQRPGELAGIELYDSGIGFVIPFRRLDEIVTVLKTGQSFYRGWLGVQIDPRVRDAVVIHRLADPSPMLSAGVIPGDTIVAANGKQVHHFGELVQALYMIPAGEQVHLEIESQDAAFAVAVRLARNIELGPLPQEEEPFDPSTPLPAPDDE
jgi:serine protease Do